jgi:hypothetical protein
MTLMEANVTEAEELKLPNTAQFTEQPRDQLLQGLRQSDGREIGGRLYGVAAGGNLEVRLCSVDEHGG